VCHLTSSWSWHPVRWDTARLHLSSPQASSSLPMPRGSIPSADAGMTPRINDRLFLVAIRETSWHKWCNPASLPIF
jgi:hypothetical protein